MILKPVLEEEIHLLYSWSQKRSSIYYLLSCTLIDKLCPRLKWALICFSININDLPNDMVEHLIVFNFFLISSFTIACQIDMSDVF